MKTKLRCGIVGYGYMGEIRRRVVEQSERLELVGVAETDARKRERISGCQSFESFDGLMDAGLDAVFVCTPNRFAPEVCIKSLRAGKHVFCEKPPGRTLEDIQSIIREETGDLKLMFGFNHRFHPSIIKAKRIIESGRLGGVLNVRGVYGKSGGLSFHTSWRNNREISGGGILLDQGIHMLDLFRYFCGEFDQVKCFLSNDHWKFEVEDNAFVLLQGREGRHAIFQSSATLWKHTFRIEIQMENGYLVVEGLLSKTGSYGRERLVMARKQFEDEADAVGNPAEEVTYFDKDLSWEMEVAEFVRCIDENTPVTICSSLDALKAMEIVEMAYQDAANNAGTVLP